MIYIMTNISQDVDGDVYTGTPFFFKTKEEAVKKAKEELADDFGRSVEDIEHEANEGFGGTYVLSMSRDGRSEHYVVHEIPDRLKNHM